MRLLFTWLLRIVIGGVFIYSGFEKLKDGTFAFADSINNFELLPEQLIMPIAYFLPAFELIVGILLIIGGNFFRAVSMLSIFGMTLIFGAAIFSAISRGIIIDCGCFGDGGPPTIGKMWLSFSKNVAIVIGLIILFFLPKKNKK